jgi:hypothetical protein
MGAATEPSLQMSTALQMSLKGSVVSFPEKNPENFPGKEKEKGKNKKDFFSNCSDFSEIW